MRCLIVSNTDRMVLMFFVPHIKLLTKLGYEVSLAVPKTDTYIHQLKEQLPDIPIHHIPFTRNLNPVKNMKAYKSLRNLIKKQDFDLIHVHTPIASFLTRMITPKGQALIYTAHGFHFHENGSKINNRIYYLAEKFAAKKTSQLIVINEDDRTQATSIFPDEKINHIKGVGVDASYFNPEHFSEDDKTKIKQSMGIPEQYQVITHVAEFTDNKRQKDIILAAEKMKSLTKEFVILLVGEGPGRDEIKAEISKRNLDEHVRCTGFLHNIHEVLSITDIGLLVSLREGLPKSLMEMMSMEIPVVATDIRGNRDLVTDCEQGYLIPLESPDDIELSCLQLMQDENLRKYLGKQGREKILKEYDLNLILGELQNIYQSFKPPVENELNVLKNNKKIKSVL
ncbi:glycosyltransferase family 1 protein [Filobacillus milosensis]|uniref:Glycosyltransferase family 1 protein n=1 Tax=Filobacillus milosensis TaxID=94137 RepID=A0A4Y8IFR2_9BACI|nr:glycosyltransferase family 4 protein [Filobacillus milosensis]TFB18907.1 glycosyltransferase family 1 protein [Filobacillus milosensis]